jgi:hypothetical protein
MMKKGLIVVTLSMMCFMSSSASAQTGGLMQPDNTLLQPMTPNAYGPGINSDAAGRPFVYQAQPSHPSQTMPDPTLQVKPDAYGPGIGMDQYGRPVQAKPWP